MKTIKNKLALSIAALFVLLVCAAGNSFAGTPIDKTTISNSSEELGETIQYGISIDDNIGVFSVKESGKDTDSLGIYRINTSYTGMDHIILSPADSKGIDPETGEPRANTTDFFDTGRTILTMDGAGNKLYTLEQGDYVNQRYIARYRISESLADPDNWDIVKENEIYLDDYSYSHISLSPVGLLVLSSNDSIYVLDEKNKELVYLTKTSSAGSATTGFSAGGFFPDTAENSNNDKFYILFTRVSQADWKEYASIYEITVDESGNIKSKCVYSTPTIRTGDEILFADFIISQAPEDATKQVSMYLIETRDQRCQIYPTDLNNISNSWTSYFDTSPIPLNDCDFVLNETVAVDLGNGSFDHKHNMNIFKDSELVDAYPYGSTFLQVETAYSPYPDVLNDPLRDMLIGVIYGPPPVPFCGPDEADLYTNKVSYNFSSESSVADFYESSSFGGYKMSTSISTSAIFVSIGNTASETKLLGTTINSTENLSSVKMETNIEITADQLNEDAKMGCLVFSNPRADTIVLSSDIKTGLNKYATNTTIVNGFQYYFLPFDITNPTADDLGTGHEDLLSGMQVMPSTYSPGDWNDTYGLFNLKELPSKYWANQLNMPETGTWVQGATLSFLDEEKKLTGYNVDMELFILGFGGGFSTVSSTTTTAQNQQEVGYSWFIPSTAGDKVDYSLKFYFMESPQDIENIEKYAIWTPDYYKDKGYKPWCVVWETIY